MKTRPRIVIVEDNYATRSLLQSILDLEGYGVTAVHDGPSALRVIDGDTPTIVVLDVMMPGMDGFTVLKQLRGDERTRHVPVLMLTALDDPESTWKGWTAGCNYYMNKPFDTDAFLKIIDQLASEVAA